MQTLGKGDHHRMKRQQQRLHDDTNETIAYMHSVWNLFSAFRNDFRIMGMGHSRGMSTLLLTYKEVLCQYIQ
jgi:hypothetical protein